MEEEYAATHSDLEAQVYIGIGTAETMAGLTDLYVSRLEERNYSSLQLTYERLYDQDHWTAYPHALDAMLLSLYREQTP